MWTTDVLREEHRWILRMLACLERMSLESERTGRLDAGEAAELMALFTHFADGLHQEREERCLFPRLLARARSVGERTSLARMSGEHEGERRSMGRLNQALLGAIYGEARSLQDFRREAASYLELQREHVLHENQELLPLADVLLTREDDEAVMRGFVDLEHGAAVKLKRVFERIGALCERIGVDLAGTA